MRSRTYYRASLFFPVLAPVLLWPMMEVLGKDSVFGLATLMLVWASVVGGIPYVAFVTAFLVWSRGKDDAAVRRAALRAPFRFIPVLYLGILFLVVQGGTEPLTAKAVFGFGALTVVVGLLFGYLYVAVAELGHALLRRRGWIEVDGERVALPPPVPGLAPAGASSPAGRRI